MSIERGSSSSVLALVVTMVTARLPSNAIRVCLQPPLVECFLYKCNTGLWLGATCSSQGSKYNLAWAINRLIGVFGAAEIQLHCSNLPW